MSKFKAGDVIDFEYNGTARRAIVLNASYAGKVHVVQLSKLSRLEKQQLYNVIYPHEATSKTWFMKIARKKMQRRPNAHLTSPIYFYSQYIGPLVRDKRSYRVFWPSKIKKVKIVTDTIRFDNSKPAVGMYKWLKL